MWGQERAAVVVRGSFGKDHLSWQIRCNSSEAEALSWSRRPLHLAIQVAVSFSKKKSKWLSVHILLETDCMHQCGDWWRLWTPRKKICGRLALLLKEVKAHAQRDWEVFFLGKRDWGGREVEIVHCSRHKNRATHYLTKYAYDEVSSVVCIR